MTEELQKLLINQASDLGELKGVSKMTNENVIELKALVSKYFEKTDENSNEIIKIHQDKKWIVMLSGIVGWVGNHFIEKFLR